MLYRRLACSHTSSPVTIDCRSRHAPTTCAHAVAGSACLGFVSDTQFVFQCLPEPSKVTILITFYAVPLCAGPQNVNCRFISFFCFTCFSVVTTIRVYGFINHTYHMICLSVDYLTKRATKPVNRSENQVVLLENRVCLITEQSKSNVPLKSVLSTGSPYQRCTIIAVHR